MPVGNKLWKKPRKWERGSDKVIRIITIMTCDRCGTAVELEGLRAYADFALPSGWALLQTRTDTEKDAAEKAMLCSTCKSLLLNFLVSKV